MPPPAQVKEQLAIFDLGIKFELLHAELGHGLFWASIVDVFMFLFAFSLFLTSVTTVWPIWFSIFHLIRGGLGLFTTYKLPRNEDMLITTFTEVLGTASIRDSQIKVSHEDFGAFMLSHARAYLKSFNTMKIPLFLMIYFLLSLVCFIFDLIAFFIGVSLMSNEISTYTDYETITSEGVKTETVYNYTVTAEAFGGPIVLILESIFLTLSLWYIIWIISCLIKLPGSISGMVAQTLIGFP